MGKKLKILKRKEGNWEAKGYTKRTSKQREIYVMLIRNWDSLVLAAWDSYVVVSTEIGEWDLGLIKPYIFLPVKSEGGNRISLLQGPTNGDQA